MGTLFKRKITRWELDGKRVKAGTAGAVKVTAMSQVYYGEYKAHDGKRKTIALYSDKGLSRQKLAKLEHDSDKRQAGFGDRFTDHSKTPLTQHLADYADYLASKDNTEDHVNRQSARIQRIVEGCKFTRLADLSADAVQTFLASLRRKPKRSIGAVTFNHHVRAVKGFTRWAVARGRIPHCPFASIARLNPKVDQRHKRRSLSAADFQTFLTVAKESSRVDKGTDWTFSGMDRHALYLTAGMTGLRASELASLTVASFDFQNHVLT